MTKTTILGDSRAFDTYYLNSMYEGGYGYDRTFCYLMTRRGLADGAGHEVVHIPDHFRAASVESNIIRLALTDPDVVVLLNGIWETLINKKMFLEYATGRIENHATHGGETLRLEYSSRVLADLFLADKLGNSPARYVERERRIISYFLRRGRKAVVMNLPVPGPDHLNCVHYAGNYRCIPEWSECLRALNERVAPMTEAYGGTVFDTDALMRETGGPGACLIDQWHFSPAFHAVVADKLGETTRALAASCGADGAQRRFTMPGIMPGEPVLVYGTGQEAADWIRDHPTVPVAGVVAPGDGRERFVSAPVMDLDAARACPAQVVVLAVAAAALPELEPGLIRALVPAGKVLLLPEEMEPLSNPSAKGREG